MLASHGLRAQARQLGGRGACPPRKILDFRSSEIAFVSVIGAGGEWRSGLYIAVSGV